jgi:glycosyltransferase involved in cell wall biosynthesis
MLAPDNRPYVVPPDEAALAEALAALLRDPALRRALGTANRARAARDFDQAAMFEAYDALFAGL